MIQKTREIREIDISISELINGNGFEEFLDLCETIFFAQDSEEDRGILSDISTEAIALHDGFVTFQVSGVVYREDYGDDVR